MSLKPDKVYMFVSSDYEVGIENTFKTERDDHIIAVGHYDGSWWVDWPAIEHVVARDNLRTVFDRNHPFALVHHLLLTSRGRLKEVTWDRSEEIAREEAARLEESKSISTTVHEARNGK